ncbi:helix-turn-helix domain-containing protein [Halalkalibacter oceani]|uniref:helix-turn-helix domain-containing protein n=1 Tax=Halalkalibacter oceani TaxID=1653776 RepID=UPI00339176C0
MSIGQLVAESRQRTGLTQQELATRTAYSRSRIANHETGKRGVRKEDWPEYCEGLDDAQFTLELHRMATGGVYIPHLDGPQVDHHPAALTYLARKELKEAKEHINQIDFAKPVSVMEDHELHHIEKTVHELLDAQAAAQTLVINLCSHLGLSYNDQVKRWIGRRMATGHIARRNG